jgi:SAM-dependent methyltransferase
MIDHSSSHSKFDCPACGVATPHLLVYRKNNCDIFRCSGCGLGCAHAVGFDPSSYYSEDYFSGGHDDGYADYVGSEKPLRREFRATLDHLRKFVRSGDLLEIGCAYGFFLLEAQAHFRVAGLEAADSAVSFCHSRGLEGVRAGLLDERALEGLPRMDAIVLLDVIEHLADPQQAFRLLAAKLNPGGVLLVTTGDWGSIVARVTGAAWRLMTPPQHLFYFTAGSLEILGRQHGLSIASRSRPWKTVPLSLVAYQTARMAGFDRRAPINGSVLSRIGIPVNLFDTVRVVFRKT